VHPVSLVRCPTFPNIDWDDFERATELARQADDIGS